VLCSDLVLDLAGGLCLASWLPQSLAGPHLGLVCEEQRVVLGSPHLGLLCEEQRVVCRGCAEALDNKPDLCQQESEERSCWGGGCRSWCLGPLV